MKATLMLGMALLLSSSLSVMDAGAQVVPFDQEFARDVEGEGWGGFRDLGFLMVSIWIPGSYLARPDEP